jgi:hypothetical protein
MSFVLEAHRYNHKGANHMKYHISVTTGQEPSYAEQLALLGGHPTEHLPTGDDQTTIFGPELPPTGYTDISGLSAAMDAGKIRGFGTEGLSES